MANPESDRSEPTRQRGEMGHGDERVRGRSDEIDGMSPKTEDSDEDAFEDIDDGDEQEQENEGNF